MLRTILRSVQPARRPPSMRAMWQGAQQRFTTQTAVQPGLSVWGGRALAATAATGAFAGCVAGHDAWTQYRRSVEPTRVSIGHSLGEGELRHRLGVFTQCLQNIDAVTIHWCNDTTMMVVGHHLNGQILLRAGAVDMKMQVQGPLRFRSQSLSHLMITRLQRALVA